MALDSCTLYRKWSIRKKIQEIQNTLADSKNLPLLKQQMNSSEKAVKEINKESNGKSYSARDIDELHRKIPLKVFGRDKLRDRICGMLRKQQDASGSGSSSSKHYSVIGIHGPAGSGKSTLAQHVCDYEKSKKANRHFDTIMSVHVSMTFSLYDIFSAMLKQMTQQDPPSGRGTQQQASVTKDLESEVKDLKNLLKEVKEKLKGKRFLLVLDDLWVDDKNDQERGILLDALNAGKRGSRILVTAQNRDAAAALGAQKQLPIPEMEEDDYLSLLMHYALQEGVDDNNGEYKIVGGAIAKKLHKSPIAAVSVGKWLFRNKDIRLWRSTANDELLKANVRLLDVTMEALWWTLQKLDADIRRCFVYCSTFPRGYIFERDELVRIWIAQGFIDTRSNKSTEELEDVGNRYFDELLSFSFLEQGRFGDEYFTIHDLRHELAERVAGTDFHRTGVNGLAKGSTSVPKEVRHLFIEMTNDNGEVTNNTLVELGNLPYLRTLIIKGRKITDNVDRLVKSIFTMMRPTKLRVLIVLFHMARRSTSSVPASVGEMKHLRYLRIHGFLMFPSTIRKLYHLQSIHAPGLSPSCDDDMANLSNLRHYNSGDGNFANIGRLTSLQTIPYFNVIQKQGYELEQLKNLNKLRGTLYIWGLENVGSQEEANKADLAAKNRVTELELSFDMVGRYPNTRREEAAGVQAKVLEGLCPPRNIVRLRISGYHGSVYPSLMTRQHMERLNSLQKLEIFGSNFPNTLTLPNSLQGLKISSCDDLQCLPTLPNSLQELTIQSCNDLQCLPTVLNSLQILDIQACSKIEVLPELPISLKKLKIYRCGKIEDLPILPNSLQTLDIAICCEIKFLPGLPNSLKELKIDQCDMIEGLPILPNSLQILYILDCKIEDLPALPNSLQILVIANCSKIKVLPALPNSLKKLRIYQCNKIEDLPTLPESLEEIRMIGCSKLEKACEEIEERHELGQDQAHALKIIHL